MGWLTWLCKVVFDYEKPDEPPLRPLREETIEALHWKPLRPPARSGKVLRGPGNLSHSAAGRFRGPSEAERLPQSPLLPGMPPPGLGALEAAWLLERPPGEPVSLALAVREFRRTCRRWKSGALSTPEAHEIFAELRKEVSGNVYLRNHAEAVPNAHSAFNLISLAGELQNATEMEPRDREIAEDAMLLTRRLASESFYSEPACRRITARRGGLSYFGLYRCRLCGGQWPDGSRGEIYNPTFALFSDRTGDLFLLSAYDDEAHRIGSISPGPERQAAIEAWDHHFPTCPAGGELRVASASSCPYCSSELVEQSRMTAFKYFEDHTVQDLTPVRKKQKRAFWPGKYGD